MKIVFFFKKMYRIHFKRLERASRLKSWKQTVLSSKGKFYNQTREKFTNSKYVLGETNQGESALGAIRTSPKKVLLGCKTE